MTPAHQANEEARSPTRPHRHVAGRPDLIDQSGDFEIR